MTKFVWAEISKASALWSILKQNSFYTHYSYLLNLNLVSLSYPSPEYGMAKSAVCNSNELNYYGELF